MMTNDGAICYRIGMGSLGAAPGPRVAQVEAWRDIEPGQTISYAALARRVGHPAAVRAVAGACAA